MSRQWSALPERKGEGGGGGGDRGTYFVTFVADDVADIEWSLSPAAVILALGAALLPRCGAASPARHMPASVLRDVSHRWVTPRDRAVAVNFTSASGVTGNVRFCLSPTMAVVQSRVVLKQQLWACLDSSTVVTVLGKEFTTRDFDNDRALATVAVDVKAYCDPLVLCNCSWMASVAQGKVTIWSLENRCPVAPRDVILPFHELTVEKVAMTKGLCPMILGDFNEATFLRKTSGSRWSLLHMDLRRSYESGEFVMHKSHEWTMASSPSAVGGLMSYNGLVYAPVFLSGRKRFALVCANTGNVTELQDVKQMIHVDDAHFCVIPCSNTSTCQVFHIGNLTAPCFVHYNTDFNSIRVLSNGLICKVSSPPSGLGKYVQVTDPTTGSVIAILRLELLQSCKDPNVVGYCCLQSSKSFVMKGP
ncbi:hypothetical protein Pelo_6512 [Pelomyxa schiedti]|nr:hypothetical protein Pelo_6512 [Pelomyxa schiedti]